MRLIDADTLIQIIDGWRESIAETYGINDEYVKVLGDVLDIIEDAPTLNKRDIDELFYGFAPTIEERKTGEWREIQRYSPTDKAAINECSICHDTIWMYDGERRWNYCPQCGSQMEIKNEKVK